MKNARKKTRSSAAAKPVARETSPPAATPSEAQRLAAAILEVLAGLRSPPQAAELLGISLPRYYQLEARALEGLVAALAPRPKGKQPALENRVRQLEKELEAARRACARQEALVRVTQRSLGLAALAGPPVRTAAKTGAQADAAASTGRRRKSRKPMLRALKAAQRLRAQADNQADDQPGPPEPASTADAAAGNSNASAVQPIAPHGAGEETRP
jgi:hypothetical protein